MEKLAIENINMLWGLVLVPLFITLFLWYRVWRKKRIAKIGDIDLVNALAPSHSQRKPWIKMALWSLVLVLLVLSLANPQTGSKLETIKREGVDLVIALDVSKSMLAEDISPNRLEKAKLFVSKLIDNLKGDRIGLIVYAGQAYAQMAITSDYSAAKMFLKTVNTNIVSTQGTDIAGAINMAEGYLQKSGTKNKVLYIISDGENHEQGALDAVKEVKNNGVYVHALGVGRPEGGPIPLKRGSNDFKKDREGNVVITKLDNEMLKKIALEGGGSYAELINVQSSIDFFLDEINKLEKTEFDSKRYADYEDQYQWFLGLAVILLIIEFFTPMSKTRWLRKLNLFNENN